MIAATQGKQKQRYDNTHLYIEYKLGRQVMVWTPVRKKGKTTKLLRKWHGLYEENQGQPSANMQDFSSYTNILLTKNIYIHKIVIIF